MPIVHIPTPLRHLSGDRASIEVDGVNLRQVFAALESECPGIAERILADGDLRTDMAVAIDGSILEGGGLVQPVRAPQVVEVAAAGELLPQKSTFFYPKLSTGMVLNPLD